MKNKILSRKRIVVGIISILGILLLLIFYANKKENTINNKEQILQIEPKLSLEGLCSGEENCVAFCLNNRNRCEQYCKDREDKLCKIIFSENNKRSLLGEVNRDCEGTKIKFDYSPVNLNKTLVMLPRGLMVGGHVTPVNHHYFQNFDNKEYNIEVYSPGKGYITTIGHMPDAEEGKDYHITIEFSCTISSYYIYVSNLPEKIKKYAPPLHDYASVRIPVEAGELIGYYKNNLDFNLIDKEITLIGFVIPEHYELEDYKIHIVPNTYEYFNEPVKSQLIAKSVRSAEPISGKIDYDIDGKLIGNWFLEGTHEYSENKIEKYWEGHLTFAYDYVDPKRIVISIAGYNGEDSKQFGIKGNLPDPKNVDVNNGLIRYELVDYRYIAPDGKYWDSKSLVKNLRSESNEIVQGVVLVQMIENRKIKFEVFPKKMVSQVSGFTENAKIYER
ncbi:hypothetical protein HYW75_01330 [Candidatus Pacearchaeota archaeon]|nr:hypothetical protein [Candidatus Pacearchaeota archaeon]